VYLHDVAKFDQKTAYSTSTWSLWAKWSGLRCDEALDRNASEIDRSSSARSRTARGSREMARQGTLRGSSRCSDSRSSSDAIRCVGASGARRDLVPISLEAGCASTSASQDGSTMPPSFLVVQGDLSLRSRKHRWRRPPDLSATGSVQVTLRRPLLTASTSFLASAGDPVGGLVALFIHRRNSRCAQAWA